MKGFLEFQILAMINKNNLSGNEIRLEIEKRRGFRPSPGTIYPVLKQLKIKGLIKENKITGKEKKYSLTNNGKKELIRCEKIFVSLFKGLCYPMK